MGPRIPTLLPGVIKKTRDLQMRLTYVTRILREFSVPSATPRRARIVSAGTSVYGHEKVALAQLACRFSRRPTGAGSAGGTTAAKMSAYDCATACQVTGAEWIRPRKSAAASSPRARSSGL
jgi:hypothetical protein